MDRAYVNAITVRDLIANREQCRGLTTTKFCKRCDKYPICEGRVKQMRDNIQRKLNHDRVDS